MDAAMVRGRTCARVQSKLRMDSLDEGAPCCGIGDATVSVADAVCAELASP